MTEQQYIDQLKKQAQEAFAGHQVVFEDLDNGRWRIKHQDHTFYYTEIVSLMNGRLFVGGDIDDCTFAYHSGVVYHDEKDASNPHIAKVRWIGYSHTDYVLEKAKIGLTDNGQLTTTWNYKVASTQLLEVADTLREEESYPIPQASNEIADELVALATPSVLSGMSENELLDILYNDMSLGELIPSSLGRVVSPRVVYAWAACHKLCKLLEK